MPCLSVLLPVYNGSKYLKEAIDSILCQSFTDFELLILNDGSTDESEEIILEYKNPVIRYIKNERNKGLIYTLNRGIELASGIFIARMDADDISMPERFQRQIRFLEQHPEIGFCGSWAYRMDSSGRITGKMRKPTDSETLHICSLFTVPYIHPTVMFRGSLLKANRYNAEFIHVEDFELWVRLQKKTRGANLPYYLLKYRWHDENISVLQNEKQSMLRKSIIKNELERYGIFMTDDDYEVHVSTFGSTDNIDLKKLRSWFVSLRKLNRKYHYFSTDKFDAFLLSRWMLACVYKGCYWQLGRFIFPSFRTVKYLFTILYQKK